MASLSEELMPGDIIDIFHIGYKDWAIYVGDGNVIHLTSPSDFPRIGSSKILVFLTGRAEVTEEPLQSAAWGCFYRVNNYLDDKCRPRPVDEIIGSARKMVHSQKTYVVLYDNSKTFVTDLRYGQPRRESSYEDPMPGDLIEIQRLMFKHWAIYVGDGYVVHLTSGDKAQDSRPESSDNSEHILKAVVKCEPLKDVANGSRYKVNNYLDKKYRPRPVDDIVTLAKDKIGEIRRYSVFQSNCEHFVTELRNRHSYSKQVRPYR
ncbi:phospholipase A and acyltransferase 1-like isoform 2-T2 [Glossophaga mutica]